VSTILRQIPARFPAVRGDICATTVLDKLRHDCQPSSGASHGVGRFTSGCVDHVERCVAVGSRAQQLGQERRVPFGCHGVQRRRLLGDLACAHSGGVPTVRLERREGGQYCGLVAPRHGPSQGSEPSPQLGHRA